MKKVFVTLFIVFGFYSISQAQRRGDNEFSITAGGNLSYIESSYDQSDITGGFNAGIAIDHYFSRAWSLKVGVSYQQKGYGDGSYTDNNGNETDGITYSLNYVTVPILAEAHFGRQNEWYINFGPYIGFLTSATGNYGFGDVKDSFNSTDGGLSVAIGIKIPVAQRTKFFVEVGGQAGFANIFAGGGDYTTNATNSLNIGLDF
jgi:hypothetical protein